MELNEIRKSPLFQGLTDNELQILVDKATPVFLREGETLMRQGEAGDSAYILVKGDFEIQKQTGQSLIKIGVHDSGTVVGEMALLTHTPRNATLIAKTNSETLRISKDTFDVLLESSSTAALAVLHWVMDRLAQNEGLLHQQEKMAALGTLSAGLAHELNNPSAAAQRSAAELQKAIFKWQALTHRIEAEAFEKNQTTWLYNFMEEASQRLEKPHKLDAMEKIDRVDELQVWLEDNDVQSAWELAPALVSFGWDSSALEMLKKGLVFELSIEWLGAGCLMASLLSEVQQATGRVSQIVKAMKSYTYLDQAPVLEVDVLDGLESTLIILQHKLKNGITIKREYASDLPQIEAYASELNQVWTNIIDNAVDAMGGKGIITLRAYAEEDNLVVEIEDNGPGIPEGIVSRVYEPFFTTKAPGKGTGLGLYISNDIISNHHHGQLLVESQPGCTKFKVMLPRKIKK